MILPARYSHGQPSRCTTRDASDIRRSLDDHRLQRRALRRVLMLHFGSLKVKSLASSEIDELYHGVATPLFFPGVADTSFCYYGPR
jgi:hypothetical protein